MIGANIVGFLERHCSRRPPRLADMERVSHLRGSRPLKDGDRVLVIGGGIAGSAFVRQLILLASREGLRIQVSMVNNTGCNYCAGLITDLAMNTLRSFLRLDVAPDVVLRRVDRCIYLNGSGSIRLEMNTPLAATLRTSRFGVTGFDDSLKTRIKENLPEGSASKVELLEPMVAQRVRREGENGPWRVSVSSGSNGETSEMEADVLVVASGFRSLGRPMLASFMESTGYLPPPVRGASVTEIDTTGAWENWIDNEMLIIDNVLPGAVVTLIPKGRNWLTFVALGRSVNREDIDCVFNHPSVRYWIDMPNASRHLRCNTVCHAKVFTGPSPRFYGDGWVALGDLTGFGRVLKDGYFASFLGSRLAAATMVYHGFGRKDFARFYYAPLRGFVPDNRIGMHMFNLNNRLNRYPWYQQLFLAAARDECRLDRYGEYIHSGLRALATGELSYRLTAGLFAAGILSYAVKHPTRLRRFCLASPGL